MAPRRSVTPTSLKQPKPPKPPKAVQKPVGVPGKCINCASLATGWFHPRCGNVESPKYKMSMPDDGSCEKFSPKSGRAAPMIQPVIREASEPDAEGLYDPEPGSTREQIEQMLANETEEPGQDV